MADSTDSTPKTLPQGVKMDTERQLGPSTKVLVANVDAGLAGLSLHSDQSDATFLYDMKHKRRGQFIIINNKKFQPKTGMNERKGTDVDADNLNSDFKKLGFEVELHHDQTALQMMQLMLKASSADHTDCDCFGVAVLSHGEKDFVHGVDDILSIDKFVQPIKKCKSLAGKPKIFIFQACRGNETDPGTEAHDGDVKEGDKEAEKRKQDAEKLAKNMRIPLEADFIYAYSTVPGYYSWRNSEAGSWFVQALHKMLQKYQYELDFAKLLTRVNYAVAYEFESRAADPSLNRKKQVPSVVSMLTKDLYFNQK